MIKILESKNRQRLMLVKRRREQAIGVSIVY